MVALHVAWMRFKDDVPPERIDRHLAACRALVGKVPVVVDLKCGASSANRSGDLTHCIVVTLPNREAIQAYLDHPEHVKIVGPLKDDIAELKVMDIED